MGGQGIAAFRWNLFDAGGWEEHWRSRTDAEQRNHVELNPPGAKSASSARVFQKASVLRLYSRTGFRRSTIAPRDPGVVGRFLHFPGHGFRDPFIEYGRDDVLRVQFLFADDAGDGLRRR